MIAPLPPGGDAIFVKAHQPEFRHPYRIHASFKEGFQNTIISVKRPDHYVLYRILRLSLAIMVAGPTVVAAIFLVGSSV